MFTTVKKQIYHPTLPSCNHLIQTLQGVPILLFTLNLVSVHMQFETHISSMPNVLLYIFTVMLNKKHDEKYSSLPKHWETCGVLLNNYVLHFKDSKCLMRGSVGRTTTH